MAEVMTTTERVTRCRCLSPVAKAFLLVAVGMSVFTVSCFAKGPWGEVAMPNCNENNTAPGMNDTLQWQFEVTENIEQAVYITAFIAMLIMTALFFGFRGTTAESIWCNIILLTVCIVLTAITVLLTVSTLTLHPLGCDGHWTLHTVGGSLLNLFVACCVLAAFAVLVWQCREKITLLSRVRESPETIRLLASSRPAAGRELRLLAAEGNDLEAGPRSAEDYGGVGVSRGGVSRDGGRGARGRTVRFKLEPTAVYFPCGEKRSCHNDDTGMAKLLRACMCAKGCAGGATADADADADAADGSGPSLSAGWTTAAPADAESERPAEKK